MDDLLKKIPAKQRDAFAAIVALTDQVCRDHLDADYGRLAREMTLVLSRKRAVLDISRGQPKTWAAGIIHALGYVNFLHDPSFPPHMTSPDLAKAFGVAQNTMSDKSKTIRDALGIVSMDPDWCVPHLLADNPLVWMLQVDGLLMDIRRAPLEIQRQAYVQGLIPYIPAERPPAEDTPDAKIIKFPGPPSETETETTQDDDSEEHQHEDPPDDNQPTLF
jgi:hypothetical protein